MDEEGNEADLLMDVYDKGEGEKEEEQDEVEDVPLILEDGLNVIEAMEVAEPPTKGMVGLFVSIINLSNTILGAGLLGVPFAVSLVGLGGGLLLFVLGAIFSILSLIYLVVCAEVASDRSYKGVARMIFPNSRIPGRLFDSAIVIKTIGVSSAYLIIICDIGTEIARDLGATQGFFATRAVYAIASLLIIIPLASMRTLNALRFTNALALACVAYLLSVVIALSAEHSSHTHGGKVLPFANEPTGLLEALPVAVFAYTCHLNLFPVHTELKQATRMRSAIVVTGAVCICATVYLVVGSVGYASFRSSTHSDILENYPKSDGLAVEVARIGILVLVLFSFPLQSHPSRVSMDSLVFPNLTPVTAAPTKCRIRDQNLLRFCGFTGLTIVVPFVISLFVDDLGVVFALVGSLASTLIAYVAPSVFYILVSSGRWYVLKKWPAILLVGIGLCIMVLSPIATVVRLMNGDQGESVH